MIEVWTSSIDMLMPVKSCMRYIICIGGRPIHWVNVLHTNIPMLIMESKYNALSTVTHDVLIIKHLATEITSAVVMSKHPAIQFRTTILGRHCWHLNTSQYGTWMHESMHKMARSRVPMVQYCSYLKAEEIESFKIGTDQ
jgi:hypothetical protein